MGKNAHLFFYAIFTSALIERRFVGWVLLSRLRDSVSSRYEDVKVFKKIEEVSKLSGVSKRTLQYYDDEGILPVKRSKNNYRLYDDETMENLMVQGNGVRFKGNKTDSRRNEAGNCNRRESK